ncbi:hypothetical protein OH807_11495 [Kitasatospora sp. NBC_01560]|uniref:hypothetical protein n=1 Tax=Kitasatospora sp. NBC_01560 TaxID=2975965 RepID=UPI00386B6420
MISSAGAGWRHRITLDGHRGPLVLAAAIALALAVPKTPLNGLYLLPVVLLAAVCNLGSAFPVVALTVLAVPVGLPLVLLWTKRERLARPGRSVLLGGALTTATAAFAFSGPAVDWTLLGLAVCAAIALAVLWPVRQLLTDPVELHHPEGAWRWAVLPLVAAAGAGLVGAQVPQQARFELSRPAMTAFAERTLADGVAHAPQGSWVGGYRASDVQAVGSGLRFTVEGAGLFEVTGWAYLPDGPPAERHGDTYTHRSGAWYTWTDNGNF